MFFFFNIVFFCQLVKCVCYCTVELVWDLHREEHDFFSQNPKACTREFVPFVLTVFSFWNGQSLSRSHWGAQGKNVFGSQCERAQFSCGPLCHETVFISFPACIWGLSESLTRLAQKTSSVRVFVPLVMIVLMFMSWSVDFTFTLWAAEKNDFGGFLCECAHRCARCSA